MITYFEAILMGLIQGLTELFPISSLGHSVIIAWVLKWNTILADESKAESFFLSFLVVLHVATALALLVFYRRVWVRIVKGFFRSLGPKRLAGNPDGKLAWLLLAATVPAGIFGLVFEHFLRTQFAKPLSAIIFLMINGCILLIGDRYQRRHHQKLGEQSLSETTRQVSSKVTFGRSILIGVAQIGALFAGISRSGITMVSGMYSGLNTEDAARFSFLLATPIIFGAGLVKLPDFFSNLDAGVRGPILAGGVAAFIAAYFAVRFLDKYFQNKSLRPFGVYCLSIGVVLLLLGAVRGHF
ncbi:MAG TPA: undecaprenyl-diphosphate phosphatase [Candidatus Saccharimonadales bacterium]|nr:undecaprenyl-diphosphate phosphatase [Candidatus Saccharimonadales bacterium]